MLLTVLHIHGQRCALIEIHRQEECDGGHNTDDENHFRQLERVSIATKQAAHEIANSPFAVAATVVVASMQRCSGIGCVCEPGVDAQAEFGDSCVHEDKECTYKLRK
jgi:hypothetical protein